MSGRHAHGSRRAELSQHFIRSRALAASLVRQAAPTGRDLVVEIGPGAGMLTAELARRCRKVLAVEIDAELCEGLRARFAGEERVRVVCADFLRFVLPTDRPYKVFGNIPFHASAAIVRRVTEARPAPDDVHLIMQREAAQRFAGGPFGPETLVSLLLKPHWQVEIVRELRREDFVPPPSVATAMLWLARRSRPLVDDSEVGAYRRFVSDCFGRRGRTVARCVKGYFSRSQLQRLSRALRFQPSAQPSELSFDQWLGLYRFHAWSGSPP